MRSRSNPFRLCSSVAITSALIAMSSVWAQQPEKPAAPATQAETNQIDPHAKELVQKVRERIANARTSSADITNVLNITGSLMQQKMESHYDFALQRPDKIAVVLTDGMMGETIVSDGKQLIHCMPMMKRYTKSDAPKDITALISQGEYMMGMGAGPLSLIGPVLLADSIGGTQSKLLSLQDAGTEKLDDQAVRRVKMKLKPTEEFSADAKDVTLDLDLLIQDGEEPTMQQIEFDLTKVLQQMMKENGEEDEPSPMRDMRYKMVVKFDDWKFNQELPEETFHFSPPAGVELASSMDEDMDEGPEHQHPMAGKPAPALELPTLTGETVTLDQFKGKEIVVLDFWATWCGPCVKALPELMEVMRDYHDKNVAFYAVDLREDADKVKQFLQKKKWDLTVLLDKEGSIASKYMVNGIPQTVIIDKNGTIQTVHIGYAPNIKKRFREELDTLLAGKNLYENKPPETSDEEPQP